MPADAARLSNDAVLGSRFAIPVSTSLGSSAQGATALNVDAVKALVEQCVQWCTRFPETRWMPVSVHVRVDGNMLGVTLRDVRISAREAQEIYHRLRERLAGMGFELQELTINGHLVAPESVG